MTEIAQTQTQTRLVKAMEHEGLRPSEAAAIIGIMPNYISMIKNPGMWDKCPAKAWDAVLLWINSGQTLKEYAEKHGKVLPPVKPEVELPPRVIAIKSIEKAERKLKSEIKDMIVTAENKDKVEAAERLSKHPYFSGVKDEHRKISIDIEINLIINGKRISL